MTRAHRLLVGLVLAGAVVIAGIGFAGSYAAVRSLALDKGFGWFANVFPIGVDAGIVVLLALDVLLTWLRIPFPLLRQTAWLLTAATIAFNGAAAWPDPLGVGMHAIIPVLFVVSVEAARHAIGRIADITADKHMESVRITRWILAPIPTFRLWRRMKLWELRSYEETIRREQDRLVYRALLRARYGAAWRYKAPVEALMPLRLARFGVPLAESAEAGLAAAGIKVPATLAAASNAPAGSVARRSAAAADSAVARDVAQTPLGRTAQPPAVNSGPGAAGEHGRPEEPFPPASVADPAVAPASVEDRRPHRPLHDATLHHGTAAPSAVRSAPVVVPPGNSYEELPAAALTVQGPVSRALNEVVPSDSSPVATPAGTAALGAPPPGRVTARLPEPRLAATAKPVERGEPEDSAAGEDGTQEPTTGEAAAVELDIEPLDQLPDDSETVGAIPAIGRPTAAAERLRQLFLDLPLAERAQEDKDLAQQWHGEVSLTYESTRKYLGRRVRRPLLRELFEGLTDDERVLPDRDVAQMLYAHVGLKWSAAEKWVRDLREELLKEHVPLVLAGSPELSDREIAERTRPTTGLEVEDAAGLIASLPRGRRRRAIRA